MRNGDPGVNVQQILLRASSLVVIVLIGYLIKRVGWVKSTDFPIFSKLVLRITLPAALITSFSQFDVHLELLFLTGIGIVVNLLQSAFSFVLRRRDGRAGQAFGVLNSGSYNIGAFATPYISGFMGPQSIIYASVFDIGNSLAAGGIAVGWAKHLAREDGRTTPLTFLRDIFSSPVFITYLSLLVIRLAAISIPAQVITFTSIVGAANPFLAMLMIGIGLELKLEGQKYAAAARLLGVRYAFATVFALAAWFGLPIAAEIRLVLCMLFFAPIAAMMSGFTQEIDGDVELSAFMTSVSILIGIVAMPALLLLLG